MNLKQLNAVSPAGKEKKRVGRGQASGQGKTAGRGSKGHKSRTGYARRLGFEGGQMPLYRRLPKRGFNNAQFRVEYAIVNTGQLNDFADGATVTIESMKQSHLVRQKSELVKILGKGALTRKLKVQAHKFSATAKQMIEAAGGVAQEIS
jgi:large subunit ribosomal protein L15